MHSSTAEPNKVPRPSDILRDAPAVKNAKIVKKITQMLSPINATIKLIFATSCIAIYLG